MQQSTTGKYIGTYVFVNVKYDMIFDKCFQLLTLIILDVKNEKNLSQQATFFV